MTEKSTGSHLRTAFGTLMIPELCGFLLLDDSLLVQARDQLVLTGSMVSCVFRFCQWFC